MIKMRKLTTATILPLAIFIIALVVGCDVCPIADPDDFTCEDMVRAFDDGVTPIQLQDAAYFAYFASKNKMAVPIHVDSRCLILTGPFLIKHAECVFQKQLKERRWYLIQETK